MLDLFKKVIGIGGTVPSVSPSKTLDKVDFLKLAKNALFVGAAAIVTYLSQHISGLDFGQWNALVIPALAGLFDLVNKWFKDNTK